MSGAAALAALAALEPVPLAELDRAAALRRRIDTKYLVPVDRLPGLIAALGATHHALEIDGARAFRYRTVYLDSPALVTFRAHRQGRRRRFKCRTRHYLDTGEHVLEVKAKGRAGETVKRRVPCGERGITRLDPDAQAFVRAAADGAWGHDELDTFSPVVETAYCRLTLADMRGFAHGSVRRVWRLRRAPPGGCSGRSPMSRSGARSRRRR